MAADYTKSDLYFNHGRWGECGVFSVLEYVSPSTDLAAVMNDVLVC